MSYWKIKKRTIVNITQSSVPQGYFLNLQNVYYSCNIQNNGTAPPHSPRDWPSQVEPMWPGGQRQVYRYISPVVPCLGSLAHVPPFWHTPALHGSVDRSDTSNTVLTHKYLLCTGLWRDQTPVTPFWHTPVDRSDTSHTILMHTCVQIVHHLWTDRTPVTLFWHKPVDRSDTTHTVLTYTLGQSWHQSHCSDTHSWTDRTPPVDRSDTSHTVLTPPPPPDRADTSHTALTHTCIARVDLWIGQQLIIHLQSVFIPAPIIFILICSAVM